MTDLLQAARLRAGEPSSFMGWAHRYIMAETSSRQFGLIVAYLLPGLIGLAGMSPLLPVVEDWLQPVEQGALVAVTGTQLVVIGALRC